MWDKYKGLCKVPYRQIGWSWRYSFCLLSIFRNSFFCFVWQGVKDCISFTFICISWFLRYINRSKTVKNEIALGSEYELVGHRLSRKSKLFPTESWREWSTDSGSRRIKPHETLLVIIQVIWSLDWVWLFQRRLEDFISMYSGPKITVRVAEKDDIEVWTVLHVDWKHPTSWSV